MEEGMKTHLTTVSVALLSTALLLGCQDQGPVGPDGLEPQFAKVKNCDPPNPHPSCPGGGDGGDGGDDGGGGGGRRVVTLENVTVTDGMKTDPNLDPPQQMELVRKGDIVKLRGLASELGEPYFFLKIDMTTTYGTGKWQDICETGHGDTAELLMDDVFLNLLKDETERTVFVVIDKSALENGDHQIQVGGVGGVAVRPSTVTIIDGDINGDYFVATFSGGRVTVGGTLLEKSPPHKFASELFCDNLDKITFTVGMKPPAAD